MLGRLWGWLGLVDAVDIVGTGGDGENKVNISTGSSILAAACGAKVAKAVINAKALQSYHLIEDTDDTYSSAMSNAYHLAPNSSNLRATRFEQKFQDSESLPLVPTTKTFLRRFIQAAQASHKVVPDMEMEFLANQVINVFT
ncbi:unnamed protein product [Arabidopsis lyrata]|nr:unnamed protein product [Arabidopsis lyrata]